MINLLPPAEKELILSDFRKRLTIILWSLVLFFIFCLILVLLSIKFYIQGQAESQKVIFEQAEDLFKQSGAQQLQGEINLVNNKLEWLDNFYGERIYIIDILEKISNIMPEGLSLTNFSSFNQKKDGENILKVSISGFALSRELLFNFKENLEKDNIFENVDFPSANWVKPNNIDFTVSFNIK